MDQKKEYELTTDELQSVSGGAGVRIIDDYEERWKGMALKPAYQTTAMEGGNASFIQPTGQPKAAKNAKR